MSRRAPRRVPTRVGVPLGVALLVALAWWATRSDRVPPQSGPATSAEADDAAVVTAERSREPSVARSEFAPPPWIDEFLGEEPETERDPPRPAGTIAARIAWKATGLPVIGARVRLQRAPRDTVIPEPGEAALPPEDDPDTTTTTDPRGHFELVYAPRREPLFLRFEIGDGTVEIEDLRVPAQNGGRAWQGEYLLDPRGTITGSIVGPDGEPVGGVTVRAVDEERFDDPAVPWAVREARIAGAETMREHDRQRLALLPFPTARTAKDGTFTIRAAREGRMHLLIQHEALVARRVDVPVAGGKTTDVGTIRLGVGVPFQVRLIDRELRPMPDVAVGIAPAGWRFGPPAGRTDDQGCVTFRLDLAADDERLETLEISVGIRRGRSDPWTPIGVASVPGATFALALPHEVVASVRTDGGPYPDRIRFGTKPKVGGLRWVQDGTTFTFFGIPPEASVVLFATADGYGVATAHASWPGLLRASTFPLRLPLVPDDEDLARIAEARSMPLLPVVLTLPQTFPIDVRVVTESGTPIEGARISLTSGHPWGRTSIPLDQLGVVDDWHLGTTGADGLLRAEGLWSGEFTFTAWHAERGHAHIAREQVGPGQRIEVVLAAPVRLTGRILEHGQPVTRRYRIRFAWPPTPYRGLRPEPPWPEYETTFFEPVEFVSNDEGRFEVPRIAPWPFAGHRWVVTVEEPSTPDAGVTFRTAAGVPSTPDLGPAFRAAMRTTYCEIDAKWRPGEHADFDLALESGERPARSELSGRVIAAGAPVHDAHVELLGKSRWSRFLGREESGLEVVATARTHVDGSFELRWRHAEVDEVRVTVQRHSAPFRIATVELPESRWPLRRSQEPIVIDVDTGDLVLFLRGPDGNPLANRPVRLANESGAALLAVSDATGTVKEFAFPADAWAVAGMLENGAFAPFEPPVVVRANETTFAERDVQMR